MKLKFSFLNPEYVFACHHCNPHPDELGGGTAESGHKAPAVHLRIRIYAGSDEGRVFQRAAAINRRIQEWNQRGLDLRKELFLQAGL
ncbi:hypothetical protein D3C73_1504730 [compost metagenome]